MSGQVDLSQFLILQTNTFSWNNTKVTIGILGASHFISVEQSGSVFTEICACVDGKFSNDVTIHTANTIRNLGDVVQTKTSGILHMFDYNVKNDLTLPTATTELSRPLTNRHKLEHSFPNNEATEVGGYTFVTVDIDDTMKVQTIHTYPNKGKYVLTRSKFTNIANL